MLVFSLQKFLITHGQDSAELQLDRPWVNLECLSENTNFYGSHNFIKIQADEQFDGFWAICCVDEEKLNQFGEVIVRNLKIKAFDYDYI